MKAKLPNEVKITLPNVSERRAVHILNPSSGGKNARKYYEAALRSIEKAGGETLTSEHCGHVTELVSELFAKDPFAHAVIYGGDGTVNEAVNGIMLSGHAHTASFSVIPQGSGNDFSKYMNDSGIFKPAELNPLDLVKVTCGDHVRYFANMMNIGFDCDVVLATYRIKKSTPFQGSLAYIAGIAATLLKRKAISAKISLTGCIPLGEKNPESCTDTVIEKDILLTACANSRFCGGGFCSAPLASVNDGFMDILIVDNVSIPQFASLVSAYHDGTYIGENGEMPKKFTKVLSYHRCRKYEISGPSHFCLDGEVLETGGNTVCAEVIPNATWFAAL